MEPTDATVRDQVHRTHRRRRARQASLLAAVAIAGAAGLGAGLVRASTTPPARPPDRLPAGAVGDGAGLAVSSGAVTVDIYLDFLCPECRRTEPALAAELRALTARGSVSVVYHPVAFLDDRSDPRGYSTRAAAAAACAADGGKFEPYATALLESQPSEQGPGLGEDRLIAEGRALGLTGDAFARCVRDATYHRWVAYVSDVAASRRVTVTPTVLVDGRRLDLSGPEPGAALAVAVSAASPASPAHPAPSAARR